MRALCFTTYDSHGTNTGRSLTGLMKHALITAIIAFAIRHFYGDSAVALSSRYQSASIFTNPQNVHSKIYRIAR